MVPARRLVDIVVDFKEISSAWRMWVLSGYSGQSFVDKVWFFPGTPGCSMEKVKWRTSVRVVHDIVVNINSMKAINLGRVDSLFRPQRMHIAGFER